MLDSVIKVLSNEIEFYKNKDNPNWSNDQNAGFKKVLEYCRELVIKMRESTR